jgi:ribonuclease J
MVTTFASLISRVQQVMDAADRYDRKVIIVGRSMVDNVNVAAETGYLNIPSGILRPLSDARKLPPEQVVLVTTGSQGEPMSALVRIANGDHRDVRIVPGDTVIISASPIPGNELPISRTIDNLFRLGARVLYDRIALVHVHGHASQEELKMVLSLVRPRFFVPVHGEYRHLVAHARLAWELGIADAGIFVLEDGDVLELSEESAQVVEKVPAGPIFIDGLSTRDTRSQVLSQRRSLSKDGVVVIILTADRSTGGAPVRVKVVSSGFMDAVETEELFEGLAGEVGQLLDGGGDLWGEPDQTRSKVQKTARSFLARASRRSPMIIPVVLDT